MSLILQLGVAMAMMSLGLVLYLKFTRASALHKADRREPQVVAGTAPLDQTAVESAGRQRQAPRL